MDLKDIIKNRRRVLNLTLNEVAQKVGVSKATVQRWESGTIKNLRRDKISKLAKALEITPSSLMGWGSEDDIYRHENVLTPSYKSLTMAESTADHQIEIATSLDADFCVKMQDDSMMNSGLKKDDIIFIRRQNTVKHGELAAVKIKDKLTLRRVFMIGETLQLHPDNANYAPLIIAEASPNIRIMGRALAFQRSI